MIAASTVFDLSAGIVLDTIIIAQPCHLLSFDSLSSTVLNMLTTEPSAKAETNR
jgi:hypothetical protein